MKTLRQAICFVSLILFAAFSVKAQCTNSFQSITYDTVVIGTGNDIHTFTLSQFDPSIGTLLSAKINSTISLNYGFSLTNIEAVQRNFSVKVGRYDNYNSPALSSPYSGFVDTSIGSYLLDPGNTITKSPYTILYRYSQNDSVTSDAVNFLGNNKATFNYTPITYTVLTGSNIYSYSATATDTIHFSVTYYYCNSAILASDIISFSANKLSKEIINLSWATMDMPNSIIYEIQAGSSSSQLSTVGSINSDGSNNYSYKYKIAATEQGKLYFRIKIIEATGEVKYSEIKQVNLDNDNTISNAFIYPNPAQNYININLDKSDWEIGIFSATGNLIQLDQFINTSFAHINFKSSLVPGTYFIKAESLVNQSKRIAGFIVK
jgi:hypothetical protein